MNLTTASLTDHNPDPSPSTATEGGNERSVYDDIHGLLGLFPAGPKTQRVLPSKHRGGRIPKLSPEAKARKHRAEARLLQARKTQFLDAKVLLEVSGD